jgi:hypothetical protein
MFGMRRFSLKNEFEITDQQTDFMVGALDGPSRYSGRALRAAHPHIMITENVFELRTKLLCLNVRKDGTQIQSLMSRTRWLYCTLLTLVSIGPKTLIYFRQLVDLGSKFISSPTL